MLGNRFRLQGAAQIADESQSILHAIPSAPQSIPIVDEKLLLSRPRSGKFVLVRDHVAEIRRRFQCFFRFSGRAQDHAWS